MWTENHDGNRHGCFEDDINEATYGRLRDALGPLQTTKAVLSTYTGERSPVQGAVTVPVKYESQQKLNALIVKGGGPNLLGRDWLEEIRLDWETIFQIASDNTQSALQDVLSKYQDVFAEGLGTLKGCKGEDLRGSRRGTKIHQSQSSTLRIEKQCRT